MKKISLLLLLSVICPLFAVDYDKLSMHDFLKMARRSNPTATYAKLNGTLQHQRKGAKLLTVPLYFGIILRPERTAGQIVINKSEGYLLGQSKQAALTTVTPMKKNQGNLLGYCGVRASDLTMSFLFCKPEKELEPELLSVVPCRVLLLDNPADKEKIKVWISRQHCFPMLAEFTRYGETKPYRTLEADGFTKKNELYYVRKIRLEGPGWRTRIEFNAGSAEVDKLDPAKPPKVIISF